MTSLFLPFFRSKYCIFFIDIGQSWQVNDIVRFFLSRPEQLSLEVWDYIFCQTDKFPKTSISKATLDTLRNEFKYWYPVDVRMSGKDLIQNHLTYFIYCHTAMWPKDK